MSLELRLLEHGHAILHHLEATARARLEMHFGIREGLPDLGRQTGGPRLVASKRAVFDRDLHAGYPWWRRKKYNAVAASNVSATQSPSSFFSSSVKRSSSRPVDMHFTTVLSPFGDAFPSTLVWTSVWPASSARTAARSVSWTGSRSALG